MTLNNHARAPWAALLASTMLATGIAAPARAAEPPVPTVLAKEVSYDANGKLQAIKGGETLAELGNSDAHTLAQMIGQPRGTDSGIALDFQDPALEGTIAYGPIVENETYRPVSFQPKTAKIHQGRALMEMKTVFTGTNDIMRLTQRKEGVLGFRVIDAGGRILYEGRVAFKGDGPYEVVPTLIEGPYVNLLTPTGATISFETQVPIKASIVVGGRSFADAEAATHHEIAVSGLSAATGYDYVVHYGDRTETHRFRTALAAGSRTPFTFAFVANNRGTTGGGDRDIGNVNFMAARADMAFATAHGAAFMQVMGGNSLGNSTSVGGHLLEHADFKRAYEPFWGSVPVYVGMGNHEANYNYFAADSVSHKKTWVDRFPYATESGEATFARAFVNPTNGPESEDGASYDPDPNKQDFPTYKKNVYYYTYGNVAMIVLASEYWKSSSPSVSGAPEGYVMDRQLAWLKETIATLEKDPKIDHVFINLHSSIFPNGNHGDAGMWYLGNNDPRPMVAGVRLAKGIIERRDELIDAAINHSKKVVGFLTGSEHNFSALHVTPGMPMYPAAYAPAKITVSRDFYYVNDGAGGVYPYGQLHDFPWDSRTLSFTAPPAVSLFHVNGAHVVMEVVNPETFEPITTITMR